MASAAELARFYRQKLAWHRCTGRFECARLLVPVDYAHPATATLQLVVARLPATDRAHRIGSLVLNPGGPGASGVDYALGADSVLSSALRKRFDVVGFDPRGVGLSAPVRCLTDRETDTFLAADATPDTAAEERQYATLSTLLGRECKAKAPLLLAHVSTVEAARDIDVLRQALGDSRLHYLGASYGTFLGATYAGLFPTRVATMVLDGALDPALTSPQIDEGQVLGFETALRAFVSDCYRHSGCPLPRPLTAGLAEVGNIIAASDRHPLRSDERRRVTQSLVELGIVYPLYDKPSWPDLRQALAQARKGVGTLLLQFADAYSHRDEKGHFYDNSNDVIYAVNCLDRPPSLSGVPQARAQAARFAALSPRFGRYIAWSELPCTTWPVKPTAAAHPITAQGSPPILVVGTTRDPATPYAWAVSLAHELSAGVLLSRDGDGHTAYHQGSSCVDSAVDSYLLGASVPKDDTQCS